MRLWFPPLEQYTLALLLGVLLAPQLQVAPLGPLPLVPTLMLLMAFGLAAGRRGAALVATFGLGVLLAVMQGMEVTVPARADVPAEFFLEVSGEWRDLSEPGFDGGASRGGSSGYLAPMTLQRARYFQPVGATLDLSRRDLWARLPAGSRPPRELRVRGRLQQSPQLENFGASGSGWLGDRQGRSSLPVRQEPKALGGGRSRGVKSGAFTW